MAENKNGLVVDPNDPNYKIKPGDSTEAVQQTNQSELVVDPNDPNYQVKPANMVAEPTTPSTTDTGQTTPNSNEEPKQETTPVANNGEQQATQTTGTQNDVTTPKANTPQVNPADYTFTESELQAMEQQQTPQGGVVSDGVSSTHLYNYSDPGTSIDKILADPGNENSTNAILNDYFRWCQETGTPIDYFTVNAAIHNKDISKSPADNAKEEKRQRNKEKWDKVGNFLLHLGNVVGNVAGGGMGSVKLEDPVHWSERQRLLKERTEQLQNSYNQSTLAQMTKQNAEMRQTEMQKARDKQAQQKLENEKRKLDRQDEDQRLRNRKQDWLEKYQAGILDDKAERRRIDEDYKKGRISLMERDTATRELNAMTNSYKAHNPRPIQPTETTTTRTNASGTTTTKVVKKPAGSAGSNNNSSSTPPSRQKQKQNQGNNNTPPSRR